MNFVTVFCHECEVLSERPERNFLLHPQCATCGSHFVESLSESMTLDAIPESAPPHERILRGVSNPYFEDRFTSGLTEHGFPDTLRTPLSDTGVVYGMMEEALASLNPIVRLPNQARDVQWNGRGGSLTAMMNLMSLPVSPTLPPSSAPDPRTLKRESVCDRNGHLTRECCVICHEQYRRNESVITLPCDHIFHEDCVMRWLHDHDTCPVCRFKLPTRTIQSQSAGQNNRVSNSTPATSPAARGRNAISSSSSEYALSVVARDGPNPSSRNRRRRAQRNGTQFSRPNQTPSFIPFDVSHQEQIQRPLDQYQALRNEVSQIQDQERADFLTQLQRINDILNSSSNSGATGNRNASSRSLLG